jgi:hypothetical protein
MPSTADRHWPELPPKSSGPYARVKEGLSRPRPRRLLRTAGRLLLALVALVALLGVVLFVTRTYSLDSATFPGAVRRLAIDAGPGEVSAVGSDRRDALALWQRRYSLIKPRVDRGVRDGTLRLRSHCPAASFRCAVILGAQVPKATATSVRTRSAPVTVQDLNGPVEVTTRSGQVTVQQVAAPVRVDTGSGGITLADLRGDLVARTVSAPIDLRDINGRVDLASESGAITANEQFLEAFLARTRSGWVTAIFATPPGRVDVRSASGEVILQLPAGHYRFDLHAPAGRVRLDGVASDPSATRTISITTGGGIHIHGA